MIWTGLGSLAVEAILRVSLLLGCAAALVWLLRRRSLWAGLRSSILSLVAAAAVALPLALVSVPRLEVPMPPGLSWLAPPAETVASTPASTPASTLEVQAAHLETPLQNGAQSAAVRSVGARDASSGTIGAPAEPAAPAAGDEASGFAQARAIASSSRQPLLPYVLLASWMLVAAALLARLLWGLGLAERLRRSAHPLDGEAAGAFGRSAASAGLGRVRAGWSPRLEGPAVLGVLRPQVLLPVSAREWSAERLEVVLTHELQHVRRHDLLWRLVAHLACVLYWFHPGFWWVRRRLVLDQERACDQAVLAGGTRPSSYARHLLDLAHGSERLRAVPAVPFARPNDLETRLMDLLDPRMIRLSRRGATGSREEARRSAPWLLGMTVAALAAALLAPAGAQPGSRAASGEPSRPVSEVLRDMRAVEERMEGVEARLEAAEEEAETLAGEGDVELEAAMEEYESRIEALEDELRPFEERMEEVEREYDALETSPEQERAMEAFEAEMELLEQSLEPLEDEMEALADSLEPLEQQREELERRAEPFEERMEALEDQLEPLEDELDALEDELDEARERGDEAREPALREEMRQVRERMEPIRQQQRELGHELREVFRDMPRFEPDPSTLEAMREVQERMRPIHEEIQRRVEAARPQFEALAARSAELTLPRERMESIHAEMEPVLERLEAVQEEMRPRLQEMARRHAAARPAYQRLGEIAREMGPLGEEMGRLGRELRRAMADEIVAVLQSELGASYDRSRLEQVASELLRGADIDGDGDRLELDEDAETLRRRLDEGLPEADAAVRQRLAERLSGHVFGG
ncbi:MAG: hypothetical protein DWQ30_13285 [Acidobacteria bacterium]|nr:MAG: hypothetical protein DWQ30_13285 [Acidobacteriota bacterium]